MRAILNGIDGNRKSNVADGFAKLESEGWLNVTPNGVELTPKGFLQIDRHLPIFFDPQYQSTRYT